MKREGAYFPSLDAHAECAELQMRQTLAMGLIPLGIALFLMAMVSPGPIPAGLWPGAGGALALMGAMRALWARARRAPLEGFAPAHFLIRYGLLAICPLLVWAVFGDSILAQSGAMPPVLVGLLILLYPANRLIRERLAPAPEEHPRLELAHLLLVHAQTGMVVLALGGMLAGAVRDAQGDYATDATSLLLFIWLVVMLVMLGVVLSLFLHWQRLFGRRLQMQKLDDDPPPPKDLPTRFGSERF